MAVHSFFKFVHVGLLATALQYLILVALVEWFNRDAVTASTIGYTISAIFNYTANYYLTFKSDAQHRFAAARFALVAGLGILFNYALMLLLVDIWQLVYLLAQIIATAALTMTNYFAHRFWTYRR